jgi:hypothetical protein
MIDALALIATALTVDSTSRQSTDRQPTAAPFARLHVFLDCPDFCHDDYLREEVEFVDYVRDRSDADVHVLVTRARTSSGGPEFTLAFIGLSRFASTTRHLTSTSESTDSDEQVRRRLATALTVGLLAYLAPDHVPEGLSVEAQVAGGGPPLADRDRWNRWIFSLSGFAEFEAEESQRNRNWNFDVSADRITPAWKISIGVEIQQSRQEFDLDADKPLAVERRSRSGNLLAVRSLGEHWSVGMNAQVGSSTFDNTALDLELAPAVEWNFFPYSMYTRRQLRLLYAVGGVRRRYYEETLFGKLEETRGGQEISGTYEQREPWGTLEGRLEWANYFPGFATNRVSVDGEIDVRIARGLSLSVEVSASRIRDQLSLPRRNATPEEVLLRLRQLSSGFETSVQFGVEYQFGSRFAAIVNPRFGQ